MTTVALLSVSALAGCSSSGAAEGTTEISFTSWDGEDIMSPIIDAFEKENPDVTVKASYVVPAEYMNTLQTRLLAGTASDVFIINPENKVQIAENDYVVDLTDESFTDTLSPVNKTTYEVDGKLYGASISFVGRRDPL